MTLPRRAGWALSRGSPLSTRCPRRCPPRPTRRNLAAFAERGITFIPSTRVTAVDGKTVLLDNGSALPCDLFLGEPKNRAADVVVAAGRPTTGGFRLIPSRCKLVIMYGRLRGQMADQVNLERAGAAKTTVTGGNAGSRPLPHRCAFHGRFARDRGRSFHGIVGSHRRFQGLRLGLTGQGSRCERRLFACFLR